MNSPSHKTTTNDYYPFGMLMPGRSYSSTAYKYGFNGKEKDDEVSGNGNQYDYGFRIYNPRIAKFLSVDPLSQSFPYWSPFAFAGNTPIQAVDLDGLEILDFRTSMYRMITGNNMMTNQTEVDINNIPEAIRSKYNGQNMIYFTINKNLPTTNGEEGEGLSARQNISEGKRLPTFLGTAGDAEGGENWNGSEMEASPSTKGNNFSSLGGRDASSSGAATAFAAAQHAKGFAENYVNYDIWTGSTAETENRRAYYEATNIIKKYTKTTQAVSSSYTSVAAANADLTNYILDGSLPKPDSYFKNIGGANIPMRTDAQKDYVNRLMTAGNAIMKKEGIQLRDKTRNYNSSEGGSGGKGDDCPRF